MRDGTENGSFVHMIHSLQKVGSKECEEGKIYIEPQGFCVMAGIGKEEGLAEKALDSVHRTSGNEIWYHDTPAGIYQISSGTW